MKTTTKRLMKKNLFQRIDAAWTSTDMTVGEIAKTAGVSVKTARRVLDLYTRDEVTEKANS